MQVMLNDYVNERHKYRLQSVPEMMALGAYFGEGADKYSMNLPFSIELKGELDIELLEFSINKVIEEYDILHSSLEFDEGRVVVAVASDYHFELSCEDIKGNSQEEKLQYLRKYLQEKSATDMELFNATKAPFDIELFKISEDYHILYLMIHHSICDFGSVVMLFSAIFDRYNQQSTATSTKTYEDFLLEEISIVGTDLEKEEDEYWENELKGITLDVLSENSEQTKETTGDNFGYIINESQIDEVSRKNRTSSFNTAMLIIQMAIAKVNHHKNSFVQYAIANRSEEKYRQTIGCITRIISNTMIFEDDDTVLTLSQKMRRKIGNGYINRHVAYKVQFGSVPYVIASEDMESLGKFPTFNGQPLQFDFIDIERRMDIIAFLILPVPNDMAIQLLGDCERYSEHMEQLLAAIKEASEFILSNSPKTFLEYWDSNAKQSEVEETITIIQL